VRALPAFAQRLSGAPAIERRGDRFVAKRGFRIVGAPAVQIELPATSAGSLRFASDGATWGVHALDVTAQRAELADGGFGAFGLLFALLLARAVRRRAD
jgi:hypothetical protein